MTAFGVVLSGIVLLISQKDYELPSVGLVWVGRGWVRTGQGDAGVG
jgi:hypothetical protein